MKRLLTIIAFMTLWVSLFANPADNKEAAEAALAQIRAQIAHEQQSGDIKKESEARWQKILTLKNFSLPQELIAEAEVEMEWFSKHGEWDNYYRTWQLRTNSLSSLGKLQQALQETQRMLNEAQEQDNKLGRAMAYKQIGIIYLNMKQTEPAVEALKHYAELMKDEDDFNSLSNIYYRMAKAYDYDKKYEEELKVTNDWLNFLITKVGKVKKPNVRECFNSCYLARAAAFIGLNRLENARMALDTAEHHSHLINTSLALHHYYKMQARYQLSKGDATKALMFTDSVRMVTNEKDDHTEEVRAKALLLLGRGEEAAEIFHRLYHEKDSVFGRDARQHLDELNTLFQIDELKMEQQHAKFLYMLIAAGSIMLALLLLLLYGWRTAIKQKKVNEQLRLANEKVKASSKMKSEFIRNISHEIRTPLNIVSGFTQILTNPDMFLPEMDKKDLQERVTENTERITRLVDRMLMLSDVNTEAEIERIDQTSIENIVSLAIKHSAIDLHTLPGDKDAKVSFQRLLDAETNAITLITNKLQTSRILGHLLENAVKFTHEGSITLKAELTDSKVSFIVEDTGIGIPAEETEHIFEEFVQLDSFTDGTGIGLTVARSVARRMGGELWLDTSYSNGARFVFEVKRN